MVGTLARLPPQSSPGVGVPDPVRLFIARAMPAERKPTDLFAVETPLGFTVRVSVRYWATIVAKLPISRTGPKRVSFAQCLRM